jgi:hypothetical protein
LVADRKDEGEGGESPGSIARIWILAN